MCAFFKYFFKWLPQNWAAMLFRMGKRLLKAGQLLGLYLRQFHFSPQSFFYSDSMARPKMEKTLESQACGMQTAQRKMGIILYVLYLGIQTLQSVVTSLVLYYIMIFHFHISLVQTKCYTLLQLNSKFLNNSITKTSINQ